MSLLSDWKYNTTVLELEPTYVHSITEMRSHHRQIARYKHTDTCKNCSKDEIFKLNNARDFLRDHHDEIEVSFNHYLHTTTAKYFEGTGIQVEGNELLLGQVYHDFGFDSF